MVGRLLSYWEGQFSGAMLNFVGVIGNLSLIPPKNGWHLMVPVRTPSQKPTWLGWKIPMFNRKFIDSFMVDLPAKSCEFSGGYIRKILGFGKRYLRSNHGNLGYQFVKFRRDSAWTPRVAPVLNAGKSLSQTGRVWEVATLTHDHSSFTSAISEKQGDHQAT